MKNIKCSGLDSGALEVICISFFISKRAEMTQFGNIELKIFSIIRTNGSILNECEKRREQAENQVRSYDFFVSNTEWHRSDMYFGARLHHYFVCVYHFHFVSRTSHCQKWCVLERGKNELIFFFSVEHNVNDKIFDCVI